MFADNSHNSTSKPTFTPSGKVNNLYENILIENISIFLNDLQNKEFPKKPNEVNYNQEFFAVVQRSLMYPPKGVIVVPNYNDLDTMGVNVTKSVDFAFLSSVQSSSKKPLYSVEAKRLPTGTGTRKKEYVTGYYLKSKSPCGGILRFKTGDHGYGLTESALIGYIEENTFDHWYITINGWIREEAGKIGSWATNECLKNLAKDESGAFARCYSVARRSSLPNIKLFHLWVVIPSSLKYCRK